ncbi:MAG: hypothetical protein MJ252_05420 [archaeon]|nr:hypothetical protein [archaeon]
MSNDRDNSQLGLNSSQLMKKSKANMGDINSALMKNISSLDEENVYFLL